MDIQPVSNLNMNFLFLNKLKYILSGIGVTINASHRKMKEVETRGK
jgi:hypothetical protein